MAETTGQNEMRMVYTFDAEKASHPLIKAEKQSVDVALTANQTLVEPTNEGENYWNGNSWASKLVVVYEFDPTQDNVYTGMSLIPEGAVLASNQTFVKPKDGLYQPMKFNGVEWVGTPKEEWEKKHPATIAPVNPSTQAMNLLGQQFAQAKVESDKQDKEVNAKIDQLTQSINLLGQMIAKTQTTGGNQ